MAASPGSFKKDRGVSHLGAIASAGAAQASAAPIPPPTSVGLAKSQDVMVEITGTLFANLPAGPSCQVGDMIIAYTKAGATPTLNCAVGDTLIGGAVVYAANTSHTFRVAEVAAGVATWIPEK